MKDQEILFQKEDQYLKTRSVKDFQSLFMMVNIVCYRQVRSLCKKHSVVMDEDKINEKALDATVRFMEMYKKNPDYRIKKSFISRLLDECKFALWGEKQIGTEQINSISYEVTFMNKNEQLQTEEVAYTNEPFEQDEKISALGETYIDPTNASLIIDSFIGEENAVALIQAAIDIKLFKTFILKVAEIRSQQYCYDNVDRLIKLFKIFDSSRIVPKKIEKPKIRAQESITIESTGSSLF